MTVEKLKEIVNLKIPGVGRGIVDYAIKNLGINEAAAGPEDLRKCANEIIKQTKILFGAEKAESIARDLSSYL